MKKTTSFRIGDKVKVTDPGCTYSTYAHMFNKMGFANTTHNPCWKPNTVGYVFAVDVHDSFGSPVVAIRHEDGRECLVGAEGLQYIGSGRVIPSAKKIETVTVPVAFLKEEHKAACPGWKQKLEDKFPEVFKVPAEPTYFNFGDYYELGTSSTSDIPLYIAYGHALPNKTYQSLIVGREYEAVIEKDSNDRTHILLKKKESK